MKKLIFLFVMAFALVALTAAEDGGCLLEGNPLEASISETFANSGTVYPETVSITLSHYDAAEVIGVETSTIKPERHRSMKLWYPNELWVDVGKACELKRCICLLNS